jgi:RNA recognition motif-containing protein
MHVLVTGDDEASVDAAAAAVGRLLEPLRDEENEHKRAQLRELAVLNGTLRERHDDGVKPGSADDDGVGVVAGSLLPPELRARVAAQYEKDARATHKLADDETLGGDHDAAYRAFLAEVGVAPRAREGEKNAGGETRDDETWDDASAVDKRKAYVGRLPPFAAEHTVRLTFQPFGAIEKVEVVPDREKNLPCRGFAFVQFREEAAARAAATYFSTRAAAFPHPPPPGFKREPFRAMDVRVKADPRPQTAAVRVAQTTPVTSHDPRCRLYVAKLPHTFSSAELRSLVAASLAGSTAGSTAEFEDGDKSSGEESIVSCDVVVDKITGLGRGFAFVRMRDAEVAARVVAALDGVQVEGRGVVVRVAAEKNRRTPTSDPSNAPSGYPTGGGFVTPLSGDPYVNAGVYDPHGNPFVYYDPRAVAAAEAAVAAANPALAAAAAAEMAAIATGAGAGPGPGHIFFSGAHGHMSPGIFPAAAATIAPGDPVEAPPPPPP